MVSDFVFASVIYKSGDWESAQLLPANLIDSMAKYTALPVAPKGVNVELGSEEIFQYPFVWLTGHLPVRFTEQERTNLRRYVERGGFMVIDDHNHDIDGIFHKTVQEEISRAFGSHEGKTKDPTDGIMSGALQPIPKDHELYHCFFKFSQGAPATQQELNGWGDQLIHHNLFALTQGGRIGLLFSSKDYSSEWDFHPDTKRFLQVDPTRFGVNMIVYALTR